MPTWLSSAHSRDQDERDLAPDVAQVQREQRADERAERHRAADLPREPRQHAHVAAAGAEHDARQLHRQREQHQHHEVGEDDHREHELAQPPARAGLRHHRRGHRRREADDDDHEQQDHREPLQPGGLRRDRSHGHAIQANATSPTIATTSVVTVMYAIADSRRPSRSTLSDSPAISAISVVAMPVITWSWPAIELGDDVAEVRPDEHAEQQIAGQPRQLEPAQDIAGDPGAKQREAERERGARGSERRRAADAAHPDDGGDGESSAASRLIARSPRAGLTKLAITSDPIAPTATTASSGAASGPAARRTLSANATRGCPAKAATGRGCPGWHRAGPRAAPPTRPASFAGCANQQIDHAEPEPRCLQLEAGAADDQDEDEQRMLKVENVAADGVAGRTSNDLQERRRLSGPLNSADSDR